MPVKNNFKIIIISLIAVAIFCVVITITLFKVSESEQVKNPPGVNPAAAAAEIKPKEDEKATSQASKIEAEQKDDKIEFEGKIKGPLLQ